MERRVELFVAIRFDCQRNQMPIRALARQYDVHRGTVRQAIASPTPERRAAVLDGIRDLVDGMLREDLAAARQQRHTARRAGGLVAALGPGCHSPGRRQAQAGGDQV